MRAQEGRDGGEDDDDRRERVEDRENEGEEEAQLLTHSSDLKQVQ